MRGSGRGALWFGVVAAWVLLLATASAQEPGQPALSAPPPGVVVLQGGDPGTVRVSINGVDLSDAGSVAAALDLDPGAPANVSISMSAPENVTWEVRAIRVGLLVSGPGSEPPTALTRVMGANTTLPPGFTVIVNRTLDLSTLKNLGAGVFLMEFKVQDDVGADLYSQSFYLHVTGNPLLTVAGATVTAVSVATGYGVWRLVTDLREFWETYRRHRQEKAHRAAHAEGRSILAAARETLKDRERLERRQAIRWSATGLGLGAVALSWAQFLGYVAFDYTSTLITALEMAALFLGVALLLIALRRRWVAWQKEEPVRTLVPTGPEPAAGEPPAEAPEKAPRAR